MPHETTDQLLARIELLDRMLASQSGRPNGVQTVADIRRQRDQAQSELDHRVRRAHALLHG